MPVQADELCPEPGGERQVPRAKRVCATSGCPTLTSTTRCEQHERESEQRRGNRHQRGYDSSYVAARAQALDGATHCATCWEPFTPSNPATGGHAKARRNGGTTADGIKPECRRCNYGWRRTGS